jgi:thiol-disulfide isomerase/thioredoxin
MVRFSFCLLTAILVATTFAFRLDANSEPQPTGLPSSVVLNFSSVRCGPCQQMSPIVSKLARDGYAIRKVDVDQERDLTNRFGITSIPAFVLVVDGREVSRQIGTMSEGELKQMLARIPAQTPPAAKSSDQAVSLGSSVTAPPPARTATSVTSALQGTNGTKATKANPEVIKLADYQDKSKSKVSLPLLGGKPTGSFVQQPVDRNARSQTNGGTAARGQQPVASEQPADRRPPALAASVRLRGRDASGLNYGSGTIIDGRDGRVMILTCGHIFRELKSDSVLEVDLFTPQGMKTFTGKPVKHNLESDVGLLVVQTDLPVSAARVAPTGTKLAPGVTVQSVGCGGGDDPTLQTIKVTTLNRYLGPDNVECSGVPVQGRSGGGLFTKEGFVVGVCSAADHHDQRGLYAGLKAIHELLDQCHLSHLYRPAGGANASDTQLANADEADFPVRQPANRVRPLPPDQPDASDNDATTGNRAELAATNETDPGSDENADEADSGAIAMAEKLRSLGAAEITCVIRPLDHPNAASRVIILDRASPRFVAYLTDEVRRQDQIQKTTLKVPDRRTQRPARPTLRLQRFERSVW